MNLLIPCSKISRQRFPCPNCHTPTPVDVVTEINSDEDLNDFIALRLNRARCSACGAQVEAPVRVGANAIVGVRYDAAEVVSAGSATEVLCYGTAVVIARNG